MITIPILLASLILLAIFLLGYFLGKSYRNDNDKGNKNNDRIKRGQALPPSKDRDTPIGAS